jgi:hypothetical protein
MIVARPKTATVSSFILFAAITLFILALNVRILVTYPTPPWYTYLIVAVLVPMLGLVIHRIFLRYKVIRLGNNQIEVWYPVLRRRYRQPLSTLVAWQELRVKTGKASTYRELEIWLDTRQKITLAYQEYTEFDRMVKYLGQKCPNKRKG